MKKTSLIFVSLTLTSIAALNLQATAYAQSTIPRSVVVEEPSVARAAAQNRDTVQIRFEGLRNIKEADLLKALRARGALISKEKIKDPVTPYLTARVVMDFLADRGYLHATVTVRAEPAPSVSEGVVFIVTEGERARIGEIVFEGNKFLSNEQLLDSISQVEKDSGPKCLPPVEYDSEIFKYCLHGATNHLRSKGYLKAKLEEPKRLETQSGLKLIVPVTEGELYRLGEIKIDGATIFTRDQILGMLSLKAGDVVDGTAIGKWLRMTLGDAYKDLGYIQYEYDIEPTFTSHAEKTDEGIVDLQITITEGARFSVRKIGFLGTTHLSNEELQRLLFIHEGEPFNQKKLAESMRNLYQLGLSDGDAERDVDYRTNEEEALLDIIIVLKGYKRQGQVNDGRPVVKRRLTASN